MKVHLVFNLNETGYLPTGVLHILFVLLIFIN